MNISTFEAKDKSLTKPYFKDFYRYQVNSISKGTIIAKDLTRGDLLHFLSENSPASDIGVGKIPSKIHTSVVIDDFVIIFFENREKSKEATKEYYKKRAELHNEFSVELAKENGIDPKSKFHKKLFEKAWEEGHSSGYGEVALEYEELAALFNETTQRLN